ncbi:hypothetical protein BB559_004179 [Furculomyces boomerangus]|uniref:Uncharacterized protein n=1 Tax=Furculomyces boomerangus TaxID=61424 RepID=A0A2T9YG76_9FUNG|nr:hypothetical protein BB559_004179 [Furculomyces boomerangus]
MGYLNYTLIALILGLSTSVLLKKSSTQREIKGKSVVIIGASSGIGKETDIQNRFLYIFFSNNNVMPVFIALEFAREGANLVLNARRESVLESVVQECKNINKDIKIVTVAGDITESKTQELVIQSTINKFKSIDFLVINAGAISVKSISEILEINPERIISGSENEILENQVPKTEKLKSALTKIMDINFYAPVEISSLFLPYLIKNQGSIIVVSSMAGIIGAPTRSLYSASKFALNGYFNSLRMELAKYKVHVALICPGTVNTNLRLSAVDINTDTPKSGGGDGHSMDNISGSKSGKLEPQTCAKYIVEAGKRNSLLVCIPFSYQISVYINTFFPSLVDYFAKKKYGYL